MASFHEVILLRSLSRNPRAMRGCRPNNSGGDLHESGSWLIFCALHVLCRFDTFCYLVSTSCTAFLSTVYWEIIYGHHAFSPAILTSGISGFETLPICFDSTESSIGVAS